MNRLRPMQKGLLLALLHVLLVSSLGAVLLIDRERMPRVWVKTAAYDPYLPVRGRYASLRLEVEVPRGIQLTDAERKIWENEPAQTWRWFPTVYRSVDLKVEDGKFVGVVTPEGRHPLWIRKHADGTDQYMLAEAIPYFIPEHVQDPTIRTQGEELWVEVTVPPKGLPRPIQVGVKKDGRLTPLNLR
ncbi:MAG TPA: hypothetical protein VEO53_15060 [Candidatus Binatia bacterium]|nr:hypothetical protein [Candidatus Binatia bacterium]